MMNQDDCDLHSPVVMNDIEVVRQMLPYGDVSVGRVNAERVNVQLISYGHETTLLLVAIQFNNVAMVELLLQYGANPNKSNYMGWPPLHLALYSSQSAALVLLLLQYGANIESTVTGVVPGAITPLCIATLQQSVECTRILLEHGADVNATNTNGNTPLINAVRMNHTEIFHVLLEFGANIFMRNSRDFTAETCAYATRQTEFALEQQRLRAPMATILRELRENIEHKCLLFALGQLRQSESRSQVPPLDSDTVNEIMHNIFKK
jgi:ankyrin repeat protein